MPIPIYINVFNRFATTRRLAAQCAAIPGARVVIIDNNSDWEPLLDWYEKGCDYEVVKLPENRGHHAPWSHIEEKSRFSEKWGQKFYVVTDCDIDIGLCPADMLERLKAPFTWNSGFVKSGLSLTISDLPDWQNGVKSWESQFWKKKCQQDGDFFLATIDTTFAMYNIDIPFNKATSTSVQCARAAPPYSARHIPWYLDCTNLDEENRNYFATAGRSNSWKPVPQQKHMHH